MSGMKVSRWLKLVAVAVAVATLIGTVGLAEAKKNRRKTVSPTIAGVIDVYAKWLRGPELFDAPIAPPPAECTDGQRDPPCVSLTRVMFMTFVGYWFIILVAHAVSHRLMSRYRKDWTAILKLGWNSGIVSGIGSLYLSINAIRMLRTPEFSVDSGRLLETRAHDLDVLMAYAIAFHAFQVKLGLLNWWAGAAVDTAGAYENVVMVILSAVALNTGKWGALACALMALDLATPVLKIGWLLKISGARSSSVAYELWDIMITLVCVCRTGVAVMVAAKSATQLEKEVSMMHPKDRRPVIFFMTLLGGMLAYWVMVARRRLRTLGGSAVADGTSRAEWLKKKKE